MPAPDGETSSAEVPSHQAPGCTSERGSKSMHWTVPTFRLQQEVEVQGPGCPILINFLQLSMRSSLGRRPKGTS